MGVRAEPGKRGKREPGEATARTGAREQPPPGESAAFPRRSPAGGTAAGRTAHRAGSTHVPARAGPAPITRRPGTRRRGPDTRPPPPVLEPQIPVAPDPGTESPNSDPILETVSEPRPRHAPAFRLLGGAPCRPPGQSRRQQVQGEGAAHEDQEQAEQGAHVGARTRTRRAAKSLEPASSSTLRADGARGMGSPTDRGGARARPRPRIRPRPCPGSARLALGPDSSRNLQSRPFQRVCLSFAFF